VAEVRELNLDEVFAVVIAIFVDVLLQELCVVAAEFSPFVELIWIVKKLRDVVVHGAVSATGPF
jgi:hypothetical protein